MKLLKFFLPLVLVLSSCSKQAYDNGCEVYLVQSDSEVIAASIVHWTLDQNPIQPLTEEYIIIRTGDDLVDALKKYRCRPDQVTMHMPQ
jgi:hypothetical protein